MNEEQGLRRAMSGQVAPLSRSGVLVNRRTKWRIRWHLWRGDKIGAQRIILDVLEGQSRR